MWSVLSFTLYLIYTGLNIRYKLIDPVLQNLQDSSVTLTQSCLNMSLSMVRYLFKSLNLLIYHSVHLIILYQNFFISSIRLTRYFLANLHNIHSMGLLLVPWEHLRISCYVKLYNFSICDIISLCESNIFCSD